MMNAFIAIHIHNVRNRDKLILCFPIIFLKNYYSHITTQFSHKYSSNIRTFYELSFLYPLKCYSYESIFSTFSECGRSRLFKLYDFAVENETRGRCVYPREKNTIIDIFFTHSSNEIVKERKSNH